MDIQGLITSGEDIYQTQYGGESFLWRPLTLREYRRIAALRAIGTFAPDGDAVAAFKLCCYNAQRFLTRASTPAGFVITVGRLIMWVSGDCNDETFFQDLEAFRAQSFNAPVYEHMKRVIALAYPSYRMDEMDEWNRTRLFEKFISAEKMIVMKGFPNYKPLGPDSFKDPDAQKSVDFDKEGQMLRHMLGNDAADEETPAIMSSAMTKNEMVIERAKAAKAKLGRKLTKREAQMIKDYVEKHGGKRNVR